MERNEMERYASLPGRRDEWIEMLPDIDIMREMHPLMWPAEKRRELLKGSPTLAKLETMVEQCAEDRVTILRALGVGALLLWRGRVRRGPVGALGRRRAR